MKTAEKRAARVTLSQDIRAVLVEALTSEAFDAHRKPYDQAVQIIVALKAAGLEIRRKRD